MREIIFWAVVGGLLLSNSLLVLSIARPELRFWPPPDPSTWRYQFTRVTGVLGPLTVVGVLAVGLLDLDSAVFSHSGRFVVGGVLFACGSRSGASPCSISKAFHQHPLINDQCRITGGRSHKPKVGRSRHRPRGTSFCASAQHLSYGLPALEEYPQLPSLSEGLAYRRPGNR